MRTPYNAPFSDALLTSVFAGIVATLVSMAFYLGYKEWTGYPLSGLINVSTLIFGINALFLVIGCAYFFLIKLRRGEIVYIIIFSLLTVAGCLEALRIHRSADTVVNFQFHQLLIGIFAIIGLSAAAGIPLLFHSRRFHDDVLE